MYEDSNVTEVVSVKFKGRGKAYYFDANGVSVSKGDDVVVETSKGLEYATCVEGNHFVSNEKVIPPIRPVIRVATESDRRIQALNRGRESEALAICRRKVAEHGLDMKLVDVEISFEGNKITFYFTSDGRVDFRELVKDLAGVFRSRIELRQIGVRDEAKILGGLGMCGRPFCCSQFLTDFQPVSTKMAKTQSLSLNPTKISGVCGRLMCCLRYEEEAYEGLVKSLPKVNAYVETPAGFGSVTQVSLLRDIVKVRLDGDGEAVIKSYSGDEIAVVPGGRPKNGEAPVHVLKPRPVPAESEEPGEAEAMEAAERPAEADVPAAQPARTTPVRRKNGHRGGRGQKPEHQERREHQERGAERPERGGREERQSRPPKGEPRRDEKQRRSSGQPRRQNQARRRPHRPKSNEAPGEG